MAAKDKALIIPEHIGIIMDGNGRWAKKRGLPRKAGHSAGASTFKKITKYCNKIGVKYLTVYAFSTENWKRPQEEVDALMNLLRSYLKDTARYKKENVKTRFIGDRAPLAPDLLQLMQKAEEDSKDATGLVLNIALNYGGRDEITRAVKEISSLVKQNSLNISEINEAVISNFLDTSGQPDPDLIIRPGGDIRLSNFMIWQSAYSEIILFDTLWPDFSSKLIDEAIEEFNRRSRRFGGI